MVDSERLIIVIENYQCLWNTALQEYHNKNLKELSWNSVCSDLIEDWPSLGQEEKNTKLNDIKKRWNNIRDYYKKEIDQQKKVGTGQPGKKRKKYVFADILDFLRPVLEPRNADSNYEKSAEQDEHETATNQSAETDYSFTATTTTATKSSSTPPTHPATPKSKNNLDKLNAFESGILKALEKKATTADIPGPHQCPVEDDPDLMFLKSLLPDVKALTTNQKFDFKLGIMQLLRSISNPVPHASSHSYTQYDDSLYRQNHQQNTPYRQNHQQNTPFRQSMRATYVSTPALSPLMHTSPNSQSIKFEPIYTPSPPPSREETYILSNMTSEEIDSIDASNDTNLSEYITFK